MKIEVPVSLLLEIQSSLRTFGGEAVGDTTVKVEKLLNDKLEQLEQDVEDKKDDLDRMVQSLRVRSLEVEQQRDRSFASHINTVKAWEQYYRKWSYNWKIDG